MSQNLPFKKVKFPKPKMYKDWVRESIASGQYKKSDFDVNYGEVERKEKDHFKQKHAPKD